MFTTTDKLDAFVVCPPRLESILEQELKGLGIKKYRQQVGGFELSCDFTMLMRLNLWLRTASRVLVRLSRFRALHLDQLERPLSKLPWDLFFQKGQTVPIHVTATHSRLIHTEAIAERVAAVLNAAGYQGQFGADLEGQEAATELLYIRCFNDVVEVSLNSSGQHLYRRGYKQEIGPAPLRENLAAALLLHMGYKGQKSFWDPCCGCGTLAIEAAMIAAHIAPGRNRDFAFLHWPCCPLNIWKNELQHADSVVKKPTFPIWASDISEKAIKMTVANATRAGVAQFISTLAAPLENIKEPPIGKGGLMLANPPYGERIQGVRGLRTVYLAFGDLLRKTPGLTGALLVDSEELAKLASKGAITSGLSFNHGGLPVTLYKL